MKKHLLPIGIFVLTLTGCSGESVDPVPTASPEESTFTSPVATEELNPVIGQGSFTFETSSSGVGTLEVPGVPDPEIERLRIQAGAPEVEYITGNLDNRQGSEPFSPREIAVYDPEGNEYTYEPASDYISEIRPSEAPAEIYNQYIDLGNSLITFIEPLQRADFIMVGPELPTEMTGVNVSSGMETHGAEPVK